MTWLFERIGSDRRGTARRCIRPTLEGLEDRCLPAIVIQEFLLPVAGSAPFGITAGPQGSLWVTESGRHQVGRVAVTGAVAKEFPVASGATPLNITTGPDANLWFTESGGRVGRLTPGGTLAEFSIRGGLTGRVAPYGITAGPDGNLWVTSRDDHVIDQVTPTGASTPLLSPSIRLESRGIAAGPDGNLWFLTGYSVGRVTPSFLFTDFSIPSGSGEAITAGPDGNLWFTEPAANKVGRITPAGVITEFPLPTADSMPFGIAAGPDGNLWFTESGAGQIGRITPAGVITEFAIPTSGSTPRGIAVGPDGNLWFTEYDANQIGRVVLEKPSEPAPLLVDVSAQVAVRRGLPRSDPHRGRSRQRLMLRNAGGTAVHGPLFVVLDGLPRRVRLRRPAGVTQAHAPLGAPFVELDVTLEPGQEVSVLLDFRNPLHRRLRYGIRVLAGPGTV
jgi:streptogramin lyase